MTESKLKLSPIAAFNMSVTIRIENDLSVILISWIFGLAGIIANMVLLKFLNSPTLQRVRAIISRSIYRQEQLLRFNQTVKPTKTTINRTFTILLINLAGSDLLGSMYLIIIASADLHHRLAHDKHNQTHFTDSSVSYLNWISNPFCYIARFINCVSIFQSAYIMMLVAIDRYISVAYPFSAILKLTQRRAKFLCLLGWLIAMSVGTTFTVAAYITFPPAPAPSYDYHNLCSFEDYADYEVRLLVLLFLIIGILVYTVILVVYAGIYYKIRQRSISIHPNHKFGSKRAEWKILKIAMIIVSTNFFFWFPGFICGIVAYIYHPIFLVNNLFRNAATNSLLLFQINCVLNPITLITFTTELNLCHSCRLLGNCKNNHSYK
ncbi:Follicle-stimulating hormone receptor [Trichoplax sp. H2]|nr:Follicle-stimulating hormone receptor [Trichoplax sp. H2]|eukprot:RDD39579.1 Follicle-stimulating hormone receptor [Trichoplax sp. H2]